MSIEQEGRVKIGISIGDVNGIAPEVIIKALSDTRMTQVCTPVIYGSSKVISLHRKTLNLQEFNYNTIRSIQEIIPRKVNLINCWEEELKLEIGKASTLTGPYALKALQAATSDLASGFIDALVTAPIDKHTIAPEGGFTGHTEFLAKAFNTNDYLMFLVSGSLRVALVTGHIPVSKISSMITKERILHKLNIMVKSLKRDFGIRKPRIALLALNPHAGDQGVIGNEDQEIVGAAVKEAYQNGVLAFGPYPSDGFFGSGQHTQFDAVLAMYHDQGLIPFKTLAFESGVNFTAGLPIVRTSPDHGTAYDIAGKGIASEASLREAIYLAVDIFNRRADYDAANAKPLAFSKLTGKGRIPSIEYLDEQLLQPYELIFLQKIKTMSFKTIDDYNFSGKRALIRVDFNVPLNNAFEVTDASRIKAAIPTIQKILKDGGSVILMSHLGRPKEGPAEKYSLKHTVTTLEKLLDRKVKFADDCMGASATDLSKDLQPGEVLLLENLRFYKQEEKGDMEFAKKLATYGDVYVNDAFGTAHRAHASTAVIAQFFKHNSLFGYVMAGELENAEKVLSKAEKPFTAIMGGAKVSDKILIIEQLMNKVDHLIIGGGMAYTFIKAQGGEIGNSLCESDKLDLAQDILQKATAKGVKIHLPVDSVNGDKFDKDAKTNVTDIRKIEAGWLGLDIGPVSAAAFAEVIKGSKTILWNGPMGVFEMPAFESGTKTVAEAIVAATAKGAFSLIGGGDSAAAINQFKMADKVSYVSTGGGALLEYIEGKELPGVKMVNEANEG